MFGMDMWVTATGALLVWAGIWSCFKVIVAVGKVERR